MNVESLPLRQLAGLSALVAIGAYLWLRQMHLHAPITARPLERLLGTVLAVAFASAFVFLALRLNRRPLPIISWIVLAPFFLGPVIYLAHVAFRSTFAAREKAEATLRSLVERAYQ